MAFTATVVPRGHYYCPEATGTLCLDRFALHGTRRRRRLVSGVCEHDHVLYKAWLTIAADASPGPSHSCYSRPAKPGQYLGLKDAGKSVLVCKLPIHLGMKDIRYAERLPQSLPLFSRSWAYQERLTSHRILHMLPDEAVWECSSALWGVCGAPCDIWNGEPEPAIQSFRMTHQSGLLNQTHMSLHWDILVEMYLVRSPALQNYRYCLLRNIIQQDSMFHYL